MPTYHEIYQHWKENPEGFWQAAAAQLEWFRFPNKIFDHTQGVYGRWFSDGLCNTCYNAVDRHVFAGRGDQAALIYDSPLTNQQCTISYHALQQQVALLGGVLRARGIDKGDRVIIYMPMVPEAVIAMLACARIGAIHSVVFGGFAANELATRIDDCTPKMIISASCGVEPGRVVEYKPLLDKAISLSGHQPEKTLILQREAYTAKLINGRDEDYNVAIESAKADGLLVDCVPMLATDPLYILYTSGTTGAPKGVMRDHGGHMVALHWTMSHIYNTQAGEVFWAASDVGWVVGHSYICYAPLLQGCTSVIYEGKPVGTPDAGAFWRVIAEHQVTVMFTAPTALRAVKKVDPAMTLRQHYDLSHFRALFLAGERADPDTIEWAKHHLGCPVVDHWWQTETAWAIAGNLLGVDNPLPLKLGSAGVPMPGYDVQVLNDEGESLGANSLGNIVVKLPLPPSCLPSLWQAEQRFRKAYLAHFPGYYATSDAGYIDEEGYVFIMSRTDDIINVAGHRLSTGAMEEVIASHADIAECAVVGVADALKGQMPVGFYVTNDGVTRSDAELEQELIALVRAQIGPVAAFKTAIAIKRLPKTRSGKILRGTMAKIADGVEWKMPATIDDPAILEEITVALQQRGYTGKAL